METRFHLPAALFTAYHLLAARGDRMVDQAMQNVLVLIDPNQNPDGRERVVRASSSSLPRHSRLARKYATARLIASETTVAMAATRRLSHNGNQSICMIG